MAPVSAGVKFIPAKRMRRGTGSGTPVKRTTLTPRQKEVLLHLAMDKPNQMIGKDMSLSQLTVKNHVQSICAIYKVRTRVGAVLKALVVGDLSMIDVHKIYASNNAPRQ